MTALDQEAFEAALRAGTPVENADLSDIDWTDLPDGRLVVRHSTVRNAIIDDAPLEGAVFEHCTFLRCSFPVSRLSQARFIQ